MHAQNRDCYTIVGIGGALIVPHRSDGSWEKRDQCSIVGNTFQGPWYKAEYAIWLQVLQGEPNRAGIRSGHEGDTVPAGQRSVSQPCCQNYGNVRIGKGFLQESRGSQANYTISNNDKRHERAPADCFQVLARLHLTPRSSFLSECCHIVVGFFVVFVLFFFVCFVFVCLL